MDLFSRKGKTIAITPLGVQKAEQFDGSGGRRTIVLCRLKENSPTTVRDLAHKSAMDYSIVELVADELVGAGYAYYLTKPSN